MNRIVHFEIPAKDPDKAIAFYKNTFGWKFTKWGDIPYWIIQTGESQPGIDGGLLERRHPEQPVVNTIEVENVDEMAKKIEANGGEIVVSKMAIPTVGWLMYFKDPDGNITGMMHADPEAK